MSFIGGHFQKIIIVLVGLLADKQAIRAPCALVFAEKNLLPYTIRYRQTDLVDESPMIKKKQSAVGCHLYNCSKENYYTENHVISDYGRLYAKFQKCLIYIFENYKKENHAVMSS